MLTPGNIQEIQKFLSGERLSTFLDLTVSKNNDDAIELHQTTMNLGVSILAVTGLIEISLRNSVCHAMNSVFGNQWLRTPPPNSFNWSYLENNSILKAIGQAQRTAYSKLTTSQQVALDKSAYPNGVPTNTKHTKRAKERQKTIIVPDSQVIAQLTIHFWKRLFSDNYEKTLWKRALKAVFPNKTIDRADVAKHLEVIYEMRNRLAHHEPVYGTRLQDILDSIEFMSLNLGSKRPNPESSFAKLIMPQRELLYGQVAIFKATFDRLG